MQTTPAKNQSFWKQAYQDAVFELDHGHLRPKLEAARQAIENRLSELFSRGGTHREFMELGDAKRTIQFLEKHELGA